MQVCSLVFDSTLTLIYHHEINPLQSTYCVEYRSTHKIDRVLIASYRCKVQLDTSPMVVSGYTKYIICSSRAELYLSMPSRSLHLMVIAR